VSKAMDDKRHKMQLDAWRRRSRVTARALAELVNRSVQKRPEAPRDDRCPGSGAPVGCGGEVECVCGWRFTVTEAVRMNRGLSRALVHLGYPHIEPQKLRVIPTHRPFRQHEEPF